MVEIGSREVELGRSWADILLRKGGHPDPEAVLRIYYPQVAAVDAVVEKIQGTSPLSFFALRIVWASTGSIIFLLIWAFFFNPTYPAPHELDGWLELIWGLHIGAGLATGLALADRYQSNPRLRLLDQSWRHYASLFGGGLFGAFLRVLISTIFFRPELGVAIQSSAWETFIFGASYAAGFLLWPGCYWLAVSQLFLTRMTSICS